MSINIDTSGTNGRLVAFFASARRTTGLIILTLLAAIAIPVAVSTPANAYNSSGCKWPSSSLRIDYRYVNGIYRNALNSARAHYNNATNVTLSLVDSNSPAWSAANSNYGMTGWNGHATRACLPVVKRITSSHMRVNMYYMDPFLPMMRIRLVWLHEMGHSLGLDHVNNPRVVMYGNGTGVVYNNGITSLQTDDRNGINSLY